MKTHWKIRAVEYLQQLKKPRAYAYYRCADPCRTRKVLARELWEYKRPPCCPGCGKRNNWTLDLNRTKDQQTKTGAYAVCHCDGAWYPHKPGSIILCTHYIKPLEGDHNDKN